MSEAASTSSSTSPASRLALWLAVAWIASGALFKLLAGSPNDLPPVLHDLPIGIGVLYPSVIGIELAVVALALLVPRVGWWLVALQLAAFLGVLGWLLVEGAESCGCFGSKVKIPPAVMMGIDGALLLGLLATRPWRSFRPGAFPIALGGAAAVAMLALPWFLDREAQAPPDGGKARPGRAPVVIPTAPAGSESVAQGEPNPADPAEAVPVEVPVEEPVEESADTSETRSGPGPTPQTEVIEEATGVLGGRQWVDLPLETFTDKMLAETKLAEWVDLSVMPQDGLWVFYRMTCDHCADHLRELWATEVGQREVVLVRVVDPDEDASAHVVEIFPEGPHVTHLTLPETVDWVVETPAEMELVAGYVMRAESVR